MELHNLKYTKGSRDHKVKTLGRGYGSGMGKRSTRGQKGQHARKSGNVRQGFEGGQTPLYRKIPKVGFNNYDFANRPVVFTTDQIANMKVVDRKSLVAAKMISKNSDAPIKIIAGKKELKAAIEVTVDAVTKGAEKIITAAKGKVNIKK
ncbi:MAG: 50S ribosomal protein L15 [Mycoplasmoidaceae bacterium]|nr:50S ribosomal protein L15 [Mycoplasmoidaceae bacterium]